MISLIISNHLAKTEKNISNYLQKSVSVFNVIMKTLIDLMIVKKKLRNIKGTLLLN